MGAIAFFNKEVTKPFEVAELKDKSLLSDSDIPSDDLSDFVVSDSFVEYESDVSSPPLSERSPYRLRSRSSPSPEKPYPKKVSKCRRTGSKKLSGLQVMGSGSTPIIGRDREIQHILSMVLHTSAGIRPLLLGPRGIGKKSIIEKLCRDINMTARKIYLVECNEMIVKCMGDDFVEKMKSRLEKIVKVAETCIRDKPIFYFRDIEKLMHLEFVSEYVQSIFLKEISIIASISEDIKIESVSKAVSILTAHNFAPILINELSLSETEQIIRNFIQTNPLLHFTDDAAKLIVELSSSHLTGQPQPVKAFNAIHQCATWNFLSRQQHAGSSGSCSDDSISRECVAGFFSTKTGIPSCDLLDESVFNKYEFCKRLNHHIVGQDYAVRIVSNRVAAAKMGFLDPDKPRGIFLFVGPTGVGKTELAEQLAKELFKNKENLLILDGSQYSEEQTVSNLVGATNGLVGHEIGGVLTGPLIDNPHRVVLFDEFEKAHDKVRKLFLQVFDKGRLMDMRGKVADCTKAVFIMTSNLGSDKLFKMVEDTRYTPDLVIDTITPILVREFSSEMCGRFSTIIPFQPIQNQHLPRLAEVQLMRMKEYLRPQAHIDLEWTQEFVSYLSGIPVDLRFGARQFCKNVKDFVELTFLRYIDKHKQKPTGKFVLDIDKEEICT